MYDDGRRYLDFDVLTQLIHEYHHKETQRQVRTVMNVVEKSLDFECPICNAKPREECHRVDGHAMPQSHSARRNLVWGIKHRTRREEVNQAVVRKDKKEQ